MDRTILILYELSKCMKSRSDKSPISSSEFGRRINVSQQTASRLLKELRDKGLIECSRGGRGQYIAITKKGFSVLEEILVNLQSFLESPEKVVIECTVVSGFGEGAYYVKEYSSRLEKLIGFVPYPGTLNLKPLTQYPCLQKFVAGEVPEFSEGGRSFGAVKFIPATVSSDSWSEPCFILLPERTHHPDELEVVCRDRLRDKYCLRDGSILKLTIGEQ